jgi:type II secretory pathway component PulF
MLYHYLAADKTGKILESEIDADNISQVLQYLAGRELRPINVKVTGEHRARFRGLFGGITTADKVFLTKYLALMLRVGTDLLSAINILIADFDKPAMKSVLLEIRENLSKGRQFYETFARYPRTFSPVFVNLVRAAEASGNLQKTFEDLSVSLQREVELRNRIRSALIYPIILLVVALSISMFLVVFAIPRIAGVFQESGITPPLFSRIVFGIGLFLNEHIIAVVVVLAIIAGPMVYFFWRTDIGRRAFSRGLGQLPVIKGLYRDIAIQQFATTFSALMKAGLPIVQATRITASVVGSEEFRASLTRIADEGLSKGLTIGEAFRRETVFPRVVTNLVAISEKAGHLSEVLDTLSEFYISNIDSKVRSLVAVLEPVLLMLMGLLVGAIALAIIVPIYELTTQF